jgi:hypothetical protein
MSCKLCNDTSEQRYWEGRWRDEKAESTRLRKGIQDYLDGDYEPKVQKMERCPHGQYGYESCEGCIDEWFQKLIEDR